MPSTRATSASLLTLLAVTAGCAADDGGPSSVAVLAASSLTEAFQALERTFEQVHPDLDVQLTFAGSQVLRLQIEHGATADIFASANADHMRALVDGGHVSHPQTLAHNDLVVIVPPGNPAGIERFEHLDRARRIVIGTAHVPVGAYTRRLFARAAETLGAPFVDRVRARVVSEEANARLVRAKVELGEADAAIVYRTDAAASDRVRVVYIPTALNVRARYQVGQLTRARNPSGADRFLALIASPAGRRALARHGFSAEAP